jgi:hypothetical protein
MLNSDEWFVVVACALLFAIVAVDVKNENVFVADFKVTCGSFGGKAVNDGTRWVCIK